MSPFVATGLPPKLPLCPSAMLPVVNVEHLVDCLRKCAAKYSCRHTLAMPEDVTRAGH